MSCIRLRYITAVAVIGLTWLAAPAVEAQGDGLFSTVERGAEPLESTAPALLDTMTLRRRVVTMDLDWVQRARAAALARSPVQRNAASPSSGGHDVASNATLTLNLFEDVVLTGVVERTAPTFSGGYSISGRLLDEPPGTITIVVNGETVAGSVRTLDGTYRIRSVGGGHYVVSEVEEPPLRCEVLEP